ncbi:hypothetical protein K6119_08080 [Paracrocinitomix mangrovi]|uniref:hypothetical protein n=1 Tax=Paracrocinitomix mangrovi TaxID=2862509 RepID=UPI001C8E14A3|nr:hypothetical protein [Paracrocinitomix mangrovi]UKN03470.1 hypothetical protein K6119_08080 [Paracrocinitomix mangrovi]
MALIGQKKYDLYIKYGELKSLDDSRQAPPKEADGISLEEISILDELERNLCTLQTGMYSQKLELEMQEVIDRLKPKLTEEVFQLLKMRAANPSIYSPPERKGLLTRIREMFGRKRHLPL